MPDGRDRDPARAGSKGLGLRQPGLSVGKTRCKGISQRLNSAKSHHLAIKSIKVDRDKFLPYRSSAEYER